MKIGIDISLLVYEGSGVATYTDQLVRHLLQQDRDNNYRLFYSSRRHPVSVINHLLEYRRLGALVYDYPLPPWLLSWLWNRMHVIPVEWLIGKVDVYHSSDFLRPPLLPGTKGITTIHDLTWKKFPEYHTPEIVAGHERKLKRTLAGNDAVIVDSQNTLKDLLYYYPGFNKRQVTVIPLGIGDRYRPITDTAEIKRRLKQHGLPYPSKYLLYVGAIEPRKRIDVMLKLFHQFLQTETGRDYQFLVVGRAGWKNEAIYQLVKDLDLTQKVRFVGYVVDDDLPYFYNAAAAFLYLSDYEGFGLPPLEAIACGTPVLAARNSSLKEILPDEFLMDTDNLREMTTQLCNLVHRKCTADKKYSWDTYVQSFLEAIRLNNHP